MKCKFLLMLLSSAVALQAALIKDVRFDCSKNCQMVFQFASDKNLPTFFQKYDNASKTLTVGFSESDFALGVGNFDVDQSSPYVRSMNVSKELYRGMNFLMIRMPVGASIASDKNAIALDKSRFLLKFSGKNGNSWTLSKLFASKKAAAEKAAREEEKRMAAERKAAEKQAALDRKAAEKQAALDRKAAREEEKRLAAERKAAEKQALLERKAAEKAARDNIAQAASAPGASALLPGLKEMTVIIGSGMEQFRLVANTSLNINKVSLPNGSFVIKLSIDGPERSPVFKVGAGSLVKSVFWDMDGLNIQLSAGAKPAILVQEGALILQTSENAIRRDGFVFWSARPNGIYVRDWMKSPDAVPEFSDFVKSYEKDSKKVVASTQTFHLRPVLRELIVVADETEFYASPSDKAPVMQRVVFGDRLVNMDLTGLYRKVQIGNKIGYVNRRAVSFTDELSAVQMERLKKVDQERGDMLTQGMRPGGSALDELYEDRVTYSSFGRRDPFVEIKGLVEEGINIDQVELVGIIWESEEPVAILVDSKNSGVSYTIKEGDKIMNGKVLKITQTDVLFLIQEFGVSRRYSMGLPDKFGGQK
ncbi:hypothetical protein FSU_0659 [Fibrobacter succinogenes subsp. succinogenes S85]|uniref:Uncharacterized protein n=1 Tax=Fibrobacter succinogenes (strain ATCC 19169 / S85) TaxID=59374 RepID=C9RKD3_FIBSS|nr:hypothetical protein [Fibrobacter succinogenes]ACX73861.1 hypothetical protein Fisuc_0249 [Fibrobacter succinogenes subsp. succinogenes S85]ADL25985.1 hypothetical protein FSU_0659 [Fibrobacter succinogenes subsp. succinogenes S85]